MKKLEILITPSYQSTRESMGYSEDDNYNDDAVLFQQGYDMNVMLVNPGEKFKIKKDFGGQVNCEETQYKFIKLKDEWDEEPDEWDGDYREQGEPIDLLTGKYKFLEDGITIEEI